MELKHIAKRDSRLSIILKEEMKISTGLMNRLKWQDRIFVNGLPQHTDYPVKTGDLVTVPLDEPEPEYPAEEGPLAVIYEDEHLLAVDKPAGMLIHPSRSRFDGTLANFVVGYYQKTGQKCAFHPVIRLDRDTFGIVLLAKNSHAHALMQQCDLKKTYHALVLGNWEQEKGIIDAPIARKPLPSLLREVSPEGKPCITEFEVLQRHESFTKLQLRPVTGRTHQLRVHCAHMGHPILGDPQYGNGESGFGLESQMLCAKTLEFTHPITGEYLVLESNMEAML
ncbi:MAG: RluA family pseudouridine synthase [Ruminococcaceae bacterium]|nr:RluA family pseudouridine synthase [Oscillospiraceae bacterium]